MSEKGKKRLLRYGITVAVAALIACGFCAVHGGFYAGQTPVERYRILSDMFTMPGIMLLLCALLIHIANDGFFDIFTYAFSYVFRAFTGNINRRESYAEYVERKREKEKMKGYACIAITGAVFLAVGLCFIAAFYQAGG